MSIPHDKLSAWRNAFVGVQFLHTPTNFLLYGAIDDLWQNSKGDYIVVDFKTTSTNEKINDLNKEWHDGYKRQMEFYEWLLRKNGYNVSDTDYFVYCNGETDREAFDGKLDFDVTIIPYEGNDSWIYNTIHDIHTHLTRNTPPQASKDCNYCAYRDASSRALFTN